MEPYEKDSEMKLKCKNISITKQDFVDPLSCREQRGTKNNGEYENMFDVAFPEHKNGYHRESYYFSCIANNDHSFDKNNLEEEQLNRFYRGTHLGSRSSGFIQDRFNIDPIAWGQQGDGQAYPGFGSPRHTYSNRPTIEHRMPVSLAESLNEKMALETEGLRFKAQIIGLHQPQQFLSTYNHDYWKKSVPLLPIGNQKTFHGKSFGGYGKPNLFRLGVDWNWIPRDFTSGSMYLPDSIVNSNGILNAKSFENGAESKGIDNSTVPGWTKLVSTGNYRFKPFERSGGPFEPIRCNPFPILMSGHKKMLNKNIIDED